LLKSLDVQFLVN